MRSISTVRSLRHSIEVYSLDNTREEIDPKHLLEETDRLRVKFGQVIERPNFRWVDVLSLMPARIYDHSHNNSLTMSSAMSTSSTLCPAAMLQLASLDHSWSSCRHGDGRLLAHPHSTNCPLLAQNKCLITRKLKRRTIALLLKS